MTVKMESESNAAELPTKHAESNVENEESAAPSSPLDAKENFRGPLQVLGVFLIIFNVWYSLSINPSVLLSAANTLVGVSPLHTDPSRASML